jgi:hypothetical protein
MVETINKNISFLILFLSAALIIVGCEKEPIEEENKNILTQPQNSFSCLLNGEEFKPKGGYPYYAYNDIKYYQNKGWFSFYALNLKDYSPESIYLYIYIDSLYQLGNHTDIIRYNHNLEIYNGINATSHYQIDTNYTHYINVTKFDLENRNIAGDFEFTVVSTDQSDTIRVTDGKFDVYNVAMIE